MKKQKPSGRKGVFYALCDTGVGSVKTDRRIAAGSAKKRKRPGEIPRLKA